MFSITQKLFLAKVILGIFICSTAIFLALYISLQTQYSLAVNMLIEHMKVIHGAEMTKRELEKYLKQEQNKDLNVIKEIKEILSTGNPEAQNDWIKIKCRF